MLVSPSLHLAKLAFSLVSSSQLSALLMHKPLFDTSNMTLHHCNVYIVICIWSTVNSECVQNADANNKDLHTQQGSSLMITGCKPPNRSVNPIGQPRKPFYLSLSLTVQKLWSSFSPEPWVSVNGFIREEQRLGHSLLYRGGSVFRLGESRTA